MGQGHVFGSQHKDIPKLNQIEREWKEDRIDLLNSQYFCG